MLIGIAGLISSGKDTAADYLCTVYGFKRMSFAAALKETISVVFGWEYELLEGSTKASREWREQVDHWWSDRLGIPNLTPRWVLQQWGTNVIRNGFHNDIWIASVENKLRNINDNVVITDCRFGNEIESIKKFNGVSIRTHRGKEPMWYNTAVELNSTTDTNVIKECKDLLENKFKIHPSEYSSVGLDYDYHLDNNKEFDHLYKQIDQIVKNPELGPLSSK